MESQARLDSNTRELSTLDKRVAELKQGFAKRTAEAETLRQALKRTQDTLSKAQALLGQLSGEKTRYVLVLSIKSAAPVHKSGGHLPTTARVSLYPFDHPNSSGCRRRSHVVRALVCFVSIASLIDVRLLCVRDCRWDRQVHEMRRAITSLPSQMMLAAGFCTYLSKTPEV